MAPIAPRGRGLHLQIPLPNDAAPGGPEAESYARAVEAELTLASRRTFASSSIVVAWSVGGGDALGLSPDDLDALLETVRRAFRFLPGAERTVEARAVSVTPAGLGVLARHRFTRICLRGDGAPEEIGVAAGLARAAGLSRVAADVFLDEERFALHLDGALRAGAEHVSLGEAAQGSLGADEWNDRHRFAAKRLAAAGLERYEGFHFAGSGAASVAIRLVSSGGDVIGVGAGAAGIVGDRRYRNIVSAAGYAAALRRDEEPVDYDECVGPVERAGERILLAIGRAGGVDAEREGARTGVDITGRLAPALDRLARSGLVRVARRRIILTDDGRENLDDVARELVAPLGGSLDKPEAGQ